MEIESTGNGKGIIDESRCPKKPPRTGDAELVPRLLKRLALQSSLQSTG